MICPHKKSQVVTLKIIFMLDIILSNIKTVPLSTFTVKNKPDTSS